MGGSFSSRAFLWLMIPAGMFAHELEVTAALAPPAIVVRSAYGGREPVPFASVRIFHPKDGKQEFQTGRTDRNGVFSFVPDGPGSWRISVDDEEGHRREIPVEVPERFTPGTQTQAAPPPVSRWERAVTGLALLFGATGLLYGFKARRNA